jgi:wyosine [tRNA(Phe)-imidazoG37] synthetase (radical SAM superfamily)
MYKHIFGPVPSRRLGISLGIDLVPHKVCTLNCIYCECGATTNLTLERKEYVPYDEVTKELNEYLNNNPHPDYITFSGSGEPTLNIRIGDITNFIKSNFPNIPIAVLTSGTLFWDKNIRSELLKADLVIPSLDAASDLSFRKINRPFHSLKISDYIDGLVNFRNEYKGKIWLEVFILPGYNDNENDLNLLKEAFLKIKPDLIQLNSLDRPGTVPNLPTATIEDFEKIIKFWNLDNIEIISKFKSRDKIQSFRKDKESAILETIARRPCTVDDISNFTGLHQNEINKYLQILEKKKLIEPENLKRGVFYKILIKR